MKQYHVYYTKRLTKKCILLGTELSLLCQKKLTYSFIYFENKHFSRTLIARRS